MMTMATTSTVMAPPSPAPSPHQTLVIDAPTNETNESLLRDFLLQKVSLQTHWPAHLLEITGDASSYPFCSVRCISSIRGGKGGFGTLLKGQSRQSGAKLTTDFGACRDLQGRRLRHVNDEIKLRKWREAQQKILAGEQDEKDVDYLTNTPSGIYNWHLMTPTWADISNKANNKMQRSLKRHFNEFASAEEKKVAEKKEKDDRYHQSVDDYVRKSSQATESLQVSDAIQQGMAATAAAAKRKRNDSDSDDDAIVTNNDDQPQPNSLITLSGELVVEVSTDAWKVQSQSDFGTMAIVLEGGGNKAKASAAADDNAPLPLILYYEVHLETAGGLHQVGWANLRDFKPNTETGDGAGDDAASYAMDASRRLTFHAGKEEAYGVSSSTTTSKAGDVLGCLYDTSAKELSYSLNGKDLGVAFTLTDGDHQPLVPALSANQGEILDLWLTKEQMKHMPKGATAVYDLMEESQEASVDVAKVVVEPVPPPLPVVPHQRQERRTSIHYNEPPEVLDTKPPSKKGKPTPENDKPLNLDDYTSIEQLMELGLDRLRGALVAIQCKGGGSLEERGKRLFALKGLERKDFPHKVQARNFVV